MIAINKEQVFLEIANDLIKSGFTIEEQDSDRPWGGFFKISEYEAARFVQTYFPGIDVEDLKISGKLSPKILLVAPFKRLSWQYHYRRAEIWRVLHGEVGVLTSFTDEQGELNLLNSGDVVKLKAEERHRLVGLEDWSVLAEIWQHTDANLPSDEFDIVRLEDDFGR